MNITYLGKQNVAIYFQELKIDYKPVSVLGQTWATGGPRAACVLHPHSAWPVSQLPNINKLLVTLVLEASRPVPHLNQIPLVMTEITGRGSSENLGKLLRGLLHYSRRGRETWAGRKENFTKRTVAFSQDGRQIIFSWNSRANWCV